MKNKIERLEENVIKVKGDVCLSEIYAQIEGIELFVEPLSAEKSLSSFMAEGGCGYNSLREGSLTRRIFKLTSSLFGESFTYGLDNLTLYNVGYPLFRILEGSPHQCGIQEFGPITEITLVVRPRQQVKVHYSSEDVSRIHVPPMSTNVLYVNDFAAQLAGLDRGGVLTTYPGGSVGKGEARNEFWPQRFLEDKIPSDQHLLRTFTVPSNLASIHQVHSEKTEGVFLALFVHLGVLVLMSGIKSAGEEIWDLISGLPLTYRLKA